MSYSLIDVFFFIHYIVMSLTIKPIYAYETIILMKAKQIPLPKMIRVVVREEYVHSHASMYMGLFADGRLGKKNRKPPPITALRRLRCGMFATYSYFFLYNYLSLLLYSGSGSFRMDW